MINCSVLRDPLNNRGTAFSASQRKALGLDGLLPARIETPDEQVARVLAVLQSKHDALERYIHLATLQNDNETLFFRALIGNLERLMPIVYTPTVGQACLEWSRIYQQPRGLHLTRHHKGRMLQVIRRWPRPVDVIVVTDGGRILGLGDLGANGMGIPIGKLALYVACGGMHPARCLPVMLDVGTDTQHIRDDPFYLGSRESRLRGEAWDELLDEFVAAVHEAFPEALLQFEDFATVDALRLLGRHRHRLCCFNDDIQGTGAMALAGLRVASRVIGKTLSQQRVLFFGAGSANIGIASLLVSALVDEGMCEADARACCWMMDSKGLVVAGRDDLAGHKRSFAQCAEPVDSLVRAIEAIRPDVLIGASGQGGAFDDGALAAMAQVSERPVILALSNPTSKAECTAEQAYRATHGRALFAAGSPFAPLTVNGRTFAPGQANNAHVFPGMGLGLHIAGAARVTDAMFLAAARALADAVTAADLAAGRLFPPVARMRDVAASVAIAVADAAHAEGLARLPRPADLPAHVHAGMYSGEYADLGC